MGPGDPTPIPGNFGDTGKRDVEGAGSTPIEGNGHEWEIVDREPHECEGSFLAVEEEKPRVMNKQQHVRVKGGTTAYRAHDHHLWNQVRTPRQRRPCELTCSCRTFLLEVFAGAAILTQDPGRLSGHWHADVIADRHQRWLQPLCTRRPTCCGLPHREGRPFAIFFALVCAPWTSWYEEPQAVDACEV